MSQAQDVVGLGNAIVDVIAHAEDAFLAAEGMAKGGMTLIDADRAESLYARMGPAVEMSGGSAANTMAGIASLGGGAAFIGKVKDDQLGAIFAHDIRALGVEFAQTGVTVNAIAPGYFLTAGNESLRRANPDFRARISARTPAGRWGVPDEEIGGAALYLASDAARYTTGSVITVDGALTAAI